jgi:hypothetical protein
MADYPLTKDWPGASRDGEPVLVFEQPPGSLQLQNKYKIRTKRVPAGAYGANWRGFFNSKVSQPPISGYHKGNQITVDCNPDDESRLIETVDAAIQYANDQLRALLPD